MFAARQELQLLSTHSASGISTKGSFQGLWVYPHLLTGVQTLHRRPKLGKVEFFSKLLF